MLSRVQESDCTVGIVWRVRSEFHLHRHLLWVQSWTRCRGRVRSKWLYISWLWGDSGFLRSSHFLCFLFLWQDQLTALQPLAGRGQWKVQNKKNTCFLLIFLNPCWWWGSLGIHLPGGLCSHKELWNFHNQDAVCPIYFSVLFPKDCGIRTILPREGD